MNIKRLCTNAILASMLFAIYFIFSQILYLEFVTFTVILLSLNLPKWNSLWIVITFVLLVWLSYGIATWSLMYIIIYPGFVLILRLLSKQLKDRLYLIATFAFFMGFLVGNLIDLPFLLFSKEVTIMYVIVGFQTTLIQGGIAFLSILLLYEPIAKQLNRLIEKGDIYE